MFHFDISSRLDKSRARVGIFHTPHYDLLTPELAIVSTEAQIRAVPKQMWQALPCRYLIVNTYHTFTKNLIEPINSAHGVHRYMDFANKTIATDSGGFQVFSLGFGQKHKISKLASIHEKTKGFIEDDVNTLKITEKGASFIYDGRNIELTPELSMEIQHKLGADIMFAFDECTSPLNSKKYTQEAMERTNRWLTRSIQAHKGYEDKQALFAIVQGGEYRDLREASARFAATQDVPGYGLGGSLGKFKEDVHAILDWTIPLLPDEKPRHFLGIGQVRDIFESVQRGVDLFDCVIPTREARHRMLYTNKGRVSVRKLKNLNEKFDADCLCLACRNGVTYATLWQLFLNHDAQAAMYATVHNIWFFAKLMEEIRQAIASNTFFELKEKYFQVF